MTDGKPVTHAECSANVGRVISKISDLHGDIKDIEIILRGAQGRNGLVKDVNFLMNQSQTMNMVISAVVGVLSAIIGTGLTLWVFG